MNAKDAGIAVFMQPLNLQNLKNSKRLNMRIWQDG